MRTLILASQSPRRKELLEKTSIPFQTSVSSIDETIDPSMSPIEIVQSLAYEKAHAVFRQHKDAVVLGADTIVVFQDEILGKPKDEKDAFRMLTKLSGNTHIVYTGVALISEEQEKVFAVDTKVRFWDLSKEEIQNYINTKEPLDKAGSYGIQDVGATLVKDISGDYFAVVGLPVGRVVRELRELGIYPVPKKETFE